MKSFHDVYVSERSRQLVNHVLSSCWLSEGEMVPRFERALSEMFGVPHPVAMNSGTAALRIALDLAGVGDGHEVIVPAQTFAATAMVVKQCGARPVFADIDPHTGNMDANDMRERATWRTSAIIPVHYGGLPCDLDEINAFADDSGLVVIEDAAHALGATYKGKSIGAISPFTAFSFQAIKMLTTGDGGALCCLDEEDEATARRLRWFGMDRNAPMNDLGVRDCAIDEVGYKCHMNNIAAAIGLGNLETIHERIAIRRVVGDLYRRELGNVPGITLLRVGNDREHAYWMFTMLVEKRAAFMVMMAAQDLPVSVVHTRIDAHPIFGGKRADLPGQDYFDRHQISLPTYDYDLACEIIEAVKGGWS